MSGVRQRVLRGTRMSEEDQPCTKCKEIKPAEAFAKRADGQRRMSHCRACRSLKRAQNRKQNPDRTKRENRESNIRRHRGMTEALFDRMFIEQRGRCGICRCVLIADGWKVNSAHIDHNHDTGKVRELLCARCNTGYGLFMEDVEILSSAIDYAIRHSGLTVESLFGTSSPHPVAH